MTFCAGFTTMTAPAPGTGTTVDESQEHILIHEGAHGTGSIACQGLRQGHPAGLRPAVARSRRCTTPTATRRSPATSWTPAARRPARSSPTPVRSPASPGIQEPLAWLDRWLEGADLHTADIYRIALDLEGQPWDGDGNSIEVGMARVAEEFPVTPPPAPPTKRDREIVAAINDRYDRVRKVLGTNVSSLILERGAALTWEPGPGRLVTIPDGFEALPIRVRIIALLAAGSERSSMRSWIGNASKPGDGHQPAGPVPTTGPRRRARAAGRPRWCRVPCAPGRSGR